jgi:hypothetical protein
MNPKKVIRFSARALAVVVGVALWLVLVPLLDLLEAAANIAVRPRGGRSRAGELRALPLPEL